MLKRFFILSKDVSTKGKALFYGGFIPIIYWAYSIGLAVVINSAKYKYIRQSNGRIISKPANTNIYIGIITGIIALVILIFIWKLFFKKIVIKRNLFKSPVFTNFFNVGQLSVSKIISMLFYVGFIFIILHGPFFTRVLSMIPKITQLNLMSFSLQLKSFLFLVVVYIVVLILWKISCELLLVFFRCFEVYYKTKKKDL